jgi:hypothetical protein
MNAKLIATLTAAVLLSAAGPALSGPDAVVAGQKVDSGLGDLPHYSKWANTSGQLAVSNQVPGQKLDSGLGDLPHYSKWADLNGTQIAQAQR